MANPVDAAANAAGQTVNAGRGLLGSAWSATKLVTKGLMVAGGLVGLFAIVGAFTGGGGLAALAPHVNLAFTGATDALGMLSEGAQTVASWLPTDVSPAVEALPSLG